MTAPPRTCATRPATTAQASQSQCGHRVTQARSKDSFALRFPREHEGKRKSPIIWVIEDYPDNGQYGAGHGGTTCPLPTTVTPPLDTTKPRARSCSLFTPTVAPSCMITFLSRMVFSTTA